MSQCPRQSGGSLRAGAGSQLSGENFRQGAQPEWYKAVWLCTNQPLRWGLPGTGLSWAPSQARGPLRCLTCSLLQFSQQEEKRQKSERLQQQQKHESQTRDMAAQCESNMGELQQLQVLPFCPAPARLTVPPTPGSQLPGGPKTLQTGEGV